MEALLTCIGTNSGGPPVWVRRESQSGRASAQLTTGAVHSGCVVQCVQTDPALVSSSSVMTCCSPVLKIRWRLFWPAPGLFWVNFLTITWVIWPPQKLFRPPQKLFRQPQGLFWQPQKSDWPPTLWPQLGRQQYEKKYNRDSYGADEQHGSQVRARKVASCAHCPLAGLALPDWLALFRDDKPNKGHSLTYMVLIPAIPWLVDDLGSLTENGRDHLSEMVQISQKSRCAYKSRVRISEMRMLVRIRAAAADRLGVGAPPLALRHCPIRWRSESQIIRVTSQIISDLDCRWGWWKEYPSHHHWLSESLSESLSARLSIIRVIMRVTGASIHKARSGPRLAGPDLVIS